MKLLEYWKALQNLLNSYDQNNSQIPYENTDDEVAYKTARNMVDEMLRMGLEIENTYLPNRKLALAHELRKLNKEKFGDGEIPSVKGANSLGFVQAVFLPNLRNSLKIEYGSAALIFSRALGMSIAAQNYQTEILIERMRAKITEYLSDHSALNKQSIFSVIEPAKSTQNVVSQNVEVAGVRLGKIPRAGN